MNKKAMQVLIPEDISEEGKHFLYERGYAIRMGSGTDAANVSSDVADCDAILVRTAPITEEVLRAGTRLRVVAKHGVGVDNIDVDAATALGIYVTNAPFSNSRTVAEWVVGAMIALARNFRQSDRETRRGNWAYRNQALGTDLEEKTLGIVGQGKIGKILAGIALHGLAMKVIAYDPFITADNALPDVEMRDDLQSLFRDSDFTSLHIPAVAENRGIIRADLIDSMKPSAFFMNAARGELVDEDALVDALRNGRIAGAGLDVFRDEPPPPDHPLFSLDNVLLAPHNSALTHEATVRMALGAAHGIDETLTGLRPTWAVNNPTGARS